MKKIYKYLFSVMWVYYARGRIWLLTPPVLRFCAAMIRKPHRALSPFDLILTATPRLRACAQPGGVRSAKNSVIVPEPGG